MQCSCWTTCHWPDPSFFPPHATALFWPPLPCSIAPCYPYTAFTCSRRSLAIYRYTGDLSCLPTSGSTVHTGPVGIAAAPSPVRIGLLIYNPVHTYLGGRLIGTSTWLPRNRLPSSGLNHFQNCNTVFETNRKGTCHFHVKLLITKWQNFAFSMADCQNTG